MSKNSVFFLSSFFFAFNLSALQLLHTNHIECCLISESISIRNLIRTVLFYDTDEISCILLKSR